MLVTLIFELWKLFFVVVKLKLFFNTLATWITLKCLFCCWDVGLLLSKGVFQLNCSGHRFPLLVVTGSSIRWRAWTRTHPPPPPPPSSPSYSQPISKRERERETICICTWTGLKFLNPTSQTTLLKENKTAVWSNLKLKAQFIYYEYDLYLYKMA